MMYTGSNIFVWIIPTWTYWNWDELFVFW